MSPKKTISGPLVLAVSSAMISIGALGAYMAFSEDPTQATHPATQAPPPPPVEVDRRTPEATAETFLDAWRKRAHDVALELSSGTARRAVLARQAEDEGLSEEHAAIKEQVWDRMASSRLALRVAEATEDGPDRLLLKGTAVGEFVGHPYEREVSFSLRRGEQEWRVESMELGEILTELPHLLDVPGQ